MTCTSHSIEARDLHNAVPADINHYASMAMHDPKAVKTIQQKLNAMGMNEAKTQERERRKLTKRLAELDKLFSALYEDVCYKGGLSKPSKYSMAASSSVAV